MRLGVIADIHGNLLARETVLTRLRHHFVDRIIHLGDSAAGPLWPAQIAALLRATEILDVRGNPDRTLGAILPERLGQSDRFAVATTDPAIPVGHRAIAYSWNSASARVSQNGREGWAHMRATGRAQP